MLGVTVNALAVIVGAVIGLLCKKGIPERLTNAIMTGIALCVLYIGISGALCGENALIAVLSMVLGAVTGTLLDIDGHVNALGERLEHRFDKSGESGSFTKAFVSTSLLFCMGAMAVVGSINAGLSGDNSVLYTKSLLDGISAVVFTSTMGLGVLFSAAFVFVYQGIICLLAGALQPVLTESVMNEMSCVGYILIIGIGLNMIGLTKIKIADYMPAIIFAPVIVWIISLF